MQKYKLITWFFLLSLSTISCANLKLQDFAYGIPLTIENNNTLYQITLPAEVYAHVAYQNFSDVKIFNAAGEMLPMQLKPITATKTVTYKLVPFFKLPTQKPTSENLSLYVKRNLAGTIVNIEDNRNPVVKQNPYLLDLTKFSHPNLIQNLLLTWKATTSNWTKSVSLYTSDNLDDWRCINTYSLAQLKSNHNQIIQNSLSISEPLGKYLLLVPNDDLALTKITAELANTNATKWQWAKVNPTSSSKNKNEYYFGKPGNAGIGALKINLPKNSTVTAAIYSRLNTDQAWTLVTKQNLYNLSVNNTQLINTTINVNNNSDQLWKIDLSSPVTITVEFGWYPQQLIFLTLGQGPFWLAYGNINSDKLDTASAATLNELLTDKTIIKAAKLGQPQTFKGAKALHVNYLYKSVIWSIIIGGVLLLGFMVLYLSKKIS